MRRRIYVAFIVVGFALGIVGYWKADGYALTSLAGAVLQALGLFVLKPDVALDAAKYNDVIRLAAVISGLSGFVIIALIWIAVAGRTVSGLWTQFVRRGHVLIVGEGAFAERLFRILRQAGEPAILATPEEIDPDDDTYAAYRIKVKPDAEALDYRAGLRRAKHVVIDRGTDGESLATAAELIGLSEAAGHSPELLAARVADPILADRFFDVVAGRRTRSEPVLTLFDENLVLARHALHTDPPFMRAAARGQKRVHALIVGFGDLGEKLLEQITLTSLARDLETPRVTVIDRLVEERRNAFSAHSPRALADLPIRFLGIDMGRDPLEKPERRSFVEELEAVEAEDPFTIIYVALPTPADNLKAALLMDRARERNGVFRAPIAYRLRVGEESGDFLCQGRPDLPDDHGFIPICVPPEEIIASVLGMTVTETWAMRIHEAYRARSQSPKAADRAWHELPETFRRSNRRIMDHLPAKLWTVGVRPEMPVTEGERNILQSIIDAPNDDPQVMKLARIEHERWCLDRRLDGWTYGAERNDALRHHNCLVPFDALLTQPELYPGEVEKDIEQVKELLRIVLDISE